MVRRMPIGMRLADQVAVVSHQGQMCATFLLTELEVCRDGSISLLGCPADD